jgi:hypothetical protein
MLAASQFVAFSQSNIEVTKSQEDKNGGKYETDKGQGNAFQYFTGRYEEKRPTCWRKLYVKVKLEL